MDSRRRSGILGVMINSDALPRNKQKILARWAALYPEAFALATAANSYTGLHIRRLKKLRLNLGDRNTPPTAIRHSVPPHKGNDQFLTSTTLETKALG